MSAKVIERRAGRMCQRFGHLPPHGHQRRDARWPARGKTGYVCLRCKDIVEPRFPLAASVPQEKNNG